MAMVGFKFLWLLFLLIDRIVAAGGGLPLMRSGLTNLETSGSSVQIYGICSKKSLDAKAHGGVLEHSGLEIAEEAGKAVLASSFVPAKRAASPKQPGHPHHPFQGQLFRPGYGRASWPWPWRRGLPSPDKVGSGQASSVSLSRPCGMDA
ncbi:hypothetical protein [Solidesulfovibrio carbinolicus]|uniref:hypothetical protein n=1 Tax=Solidesulfovibrio carbinolicus TaxID=296842 RepID=UPI001F35278E|nr:hypothetical protein [Solidesulfovibrio carbinolicus]